MAYSVFGQAGGDDEMTDDEAWNWKCWRETMRDLRPFATICREVCCFDRFPRGPYGDIRVALDRLADIRGM